MALLATVKFDELLDYRFDAECYRPELLAVDRLVASRKASPLLSVAAVSDGNHISIAGSFCGSGIRYLKGAELSDVFIDDTEPTFISKATYNSIERAHVSPGDVLVSVIGSVGPVAFVTGKYKQLSCSCKLAILKPHGISGPLLAAYLLSPTGQALLLRRNRGSVQQGVVLPDLRSFPVPHFSAALAAKVEAVMHDAANEKAKADSLYPEAESELLERLGWDALQKRPVELSYILDFDTLTKNARTDAEYYQPQYARLRAELMKQGSEEIGSFCPKPIRGVQPSIVEGGEIIVVDSKAVRPQGVEPAAEERTSLKFFNSPANAKARVQKGDVLLNSTGRGTLGRAARYQLNAAAICDNHVAILRPNSKVCDPTYLALFLNSPAGLSQSEQFQTGSSGQLEIYPEHIQQFQVFLPRNKNGSVDLAWQERLAAKVQASTAAKAKARIKLEEAKRLVEEAIQA